MKGIIAEKGSLPSAKHNSYWIHSIAYSLVENILMFFIVLIF